jgi:glycosyltransferase involved in cell wall biosynthesis
MVIISNGFSKFHLSLAASEANRRQLLSSFLTGAYPTPLVRKMLSLPYLRTNAKANRLMARQEQIPDGLIHTFFVPEALYTLGVHRHSESTIADSFRSYARSAIHHVERAAAEGARVYHFRSGFGGDSIEVARKHGMFVLCDHASVHPSLSEGFVVNMGRMPDHQEKRNVGPFFRLCLSDLERADAVLVNSSFAKDTFIYAGHRRSPVHVIYLGVDDAFFDHVPERKNATNEVRLLFAGTFAKGKGAETLIDALERLDDIPWRLEVAGPISADMAGGSRGFFANPHVKYLGNLSRQDLASAMAMADVFVFPSLHEGSARVVFEALACGCYVITTPNSGSIVEDGVHGAIVPPGESGALAEAIEYAYQHRDKVSEIGRNNAFCVRMKYRQRGYGDQLSALYKELAGEA